MSEKFPPPPPPHLPTTPPRDSDLIGLEILSRHQLFCVFVFVYCYFSSPEYINVQPELRTTALRNYFSNWLKWSPSEKTEMKSDDLNNNIPVSVECVTITAFALTQLDLVFNKNIERQILAL